jgi:two-component system LytT family response regulator
MYSLLIIEDEVKSAELLEIMISRLFTDINIIGKVQNVKDAVDIIQSKKPQIILLDINLNSESGFEILKKTNPDEYEFIVVSAYDNYTLQALKNSAIDYILKPFDFDELKLAINKAINRIHEKSFLKKEKINVNKLPISTIDGTLFIEIENIIYIKADTSYSEFFLKDGAKIIASKSLSNYESILENHHFYRVHKSYMVNLKHIIKYLKGRNGSLVMVDNSVIPIAENKKQEVLKTLEFI